MSQVTSIILLYHLGEEYQEPNPIAQINSYLASDGRGILERHDAGGFKCYQSEVWGGAFNRLDLEVFVKAVYCANWKSPLGVQMLIQGEHDDHWDLVSLAASLWANEAKAAGSILTRLVAESNCPPATAGGTDS